jgi:hypothetical protein
LLLHLGDPLFQQFNLFGEWENVRTAIRHNKSALSKLQSPPNLPRSRRCRSQPSSSISRHRCS